MKRKLILLIASIITVIFCTTPNFHPEPYLHTGYKWWLDMIFHGSYYLVISCAVYPLFKRDKFNMLYFLMVLLISYGLEIDQFYVPGRSVSLLDFTSNTLGVSLSALFSFLLYHRWILKKIN